MGASLLTLAKYIYVIVRIYEANKLLKKKV